MCVLARLICSRAIREHASCSGHTRSNRRSNERTCKHRSEGHARRGSGGLQASIGASGTTAVQSGKQPHRASKPIIVTCPFGSCDPVTDVSGFSKFDAPVSFLQPSWMPFTEARRNPPDTCTRLAFQKRAAADVCRSMAAAQRQVAESGKAKVCNRACHLARAHCATFAHCIVQVLSKVVRT